LHHLVQNRRSRFIVFVDSRKQTEQIASILARSTTVATDESDDVQATAAVDPLVSASVLPYRSGYEEADRRIIEQRLARGDLRGVISTSALELGIDVKHLDLAVLVGVPRSSTSFQQRIGRVGRSSPGTVVVVNSGEIYDEAVFRKPESLLNRPPAEGALYLENARIQFSTYTPSVLPAPEASTIKCAPQTQATQRSNPPSHGRRVSLNCVPLNGRDKSMPNFKP
jgi:DEAD/DEAH box helicase domain-containing protein